jgi:hypothetical protein
MECGWYYSKDPVYFHGIIKGQKCPKNDKDLIRIVLSREDGSENEDGLGQKSRLLWHARN